MRPTPKVGRAVWGEVSLLEHYRTIASAVRSEIPKVKGSRFIGQAAPVSAPEAALAIVAGVTAAHSDARHHCYAYRLGPAGGEWRSHDAGEPSGSAGRPILQQIEARSLTNLVVVVTRYFGGVKLGVGGLVRAYAAAAGDVLAHAAVVTVVLTMSVVVEYAYELSGTVAGVLASFDLEPGRAIYGPLVRIELEVPVALVDSFRTRMIERTGGKVVPAVLPPGGI
jgi:uncharacterized YigZ family protein